MNLILVRHGETDWNKEQRVMGPNPIPLNKTGREQAMKTAEWLSTLSFKVIYSSPYRRALETAEIIAKKQKKISVIPTPEVREVGYGDWVEMTFEEIEEKYPKYFKHYREKPSTVEIPGGEKGMEIFSRVKFFLESLRQKHDGENVLVVSHADVIKAMVVVFLNLPLDSLQRVACDNGCIAALQYGTNLGDRLTALNYFAPIDKIFRGVFDGIEK